MNILNFRKNNKGITLISLVVTIIVISILTVVSFSAMTNNNGVVNKANGARESTESKEFLELLRVYVTKVQFRNNGDINLEKYIQYLINNNVATENEITRNSNGTITLVNENGYIYEIIEKNNDIEINYIGIEEE